MDAPGWVGRRTATASIDAGMRPIDDTAATVVFRPRSAD